jgi:SHS2 domain-containing protein
MYQLIEHTADVGFWVRADDFNDLLVEAGQALFAIMILNPEQVEPRLEVVIRLVGQDPEDLLLDWLSDLLFIFEQRRLVLARFEVEVEPTGIFGRAWGEPLDLSRHHLGNEVKAITYHQLTVRRTADAWEARVIVDV